MPPLLVILAVIAGFLGLLMASQATVGVAVGGFGCMLAILARIAEAHEQHRYAHRAEMAADRERMNQQYRDSVAAVKADQPPPTPAPRWMKIAFFALIALIVLGVLAVEVLPNSVWISITR